MWPTQGAPPPADLSQRIARRCEADGQRIGPELLGKTCIAAAVRAGYSPRSATVEGARLLANAKVAAAVQEAMAAVFPDGP